MHYSTDQLFAMIAANGLNGIHARLIHERRADEMSAPSADSLWYTLMEQSKRMSPADFFGWLERLMDAPVDTGRPYASELQTVWQTTGKRPSTLLVEQLKAQAPTEVQRAIRAPYWMPRREAIFTWVFVALAIIGLYSCFRFLIRRFANS